MLQSRKSRVIFVTPTTFYEINLTKDQILAGMEIEEHIVADVVYTDTFLTILFKCCIKTNCQANGIFAYIFFYQVQCHDDFMIAIQTQ